MSEYHFCEVVQLLIGQRSFGSQEISDRSLYSADGVEAAGVADRDRISGPRRRKIQSGANFDGARGQVLLQLRQAAVE